MDVEFSDKKLDLKDRRRFQEIISKGKLTRTFSRMRLRLKNYEKDGKRTKFVINPKFICSVISIVFFIFCKLYLMTINHSYAKISILYGPPFVVVPFSSR